MQGTIKGAYLPGNSTVVLKDVPIPVPGHGQVLVKMKACTICGSDIRAIYREHVGKWPEGYQGVIAGHEPCGQVVEEGRGSGVSTGAPGWWYTIFQDAGAAMTAAWVI